ncbi:MAG: hypothetical protein Q7U37_03150 [Gallionella sp.]|nr:hypothetical protein [Gallionella sp.]
MNRDLLVLRRKKYRVTWLMRVLRCIGNYRHYRKQGVCHSIAWAMARNTL